MRVLIERFQHREEVMEPARSFRRRMVFDFCGGHRADEACETGIEVVLDFLPLALKSAFSHRLVINELTKHDASCVDVTGVGRIPVLAGSTNLRSLVLLVDLRGFYR